MKTIKERDMELERLWEELEDVPMDPETECIEEAFYIWPTGTDREEIWHWFDERYSKGVPYLLYGDGSDCTDQIAKLVYLKQFCIANAGWLWCVNESPLLPRKMAVLITFSRKMKFKRSPRWKFRLRWG